MPGAHWGGSCSAILCCSHCSPLLILILILILTLTLTLTLMLMLCYADQGASCLAGPALMPCPCPSRCMSLPLDLPQPVENRAEMASEPKREINARARRMNRQHVKTQRVASHATQDSL